MTVCREITSFSRTHERIADLFALLAVGLLFATVWFVLTYHQEVMAWVGENALLHTAILVAVAVLDVLLIGGLVMVGSARFREDERCFGTFRGRRSQRSKTGLFGTWIAHMENVGKKHR
jgi:archaellum biogenesis protein FlaJ (TadC family)